MRRPVEREVLAMSNPSLAPALSPAQARSRRASILEAAAFLDSVSSTRPDMLPTEWATFEAIPPWVLHDATALRRLALVTGALYAAPVLRLCIDARLLRRMARLVGSDALQAVLDSTGLPDADSSLLGPGSAFVPGVFFAHSAALLLAGIENFEVRKAVARVLGLSTEGVRNPVRPAATATQMAQRAHAILCEARARRGQGDAALAVAQPVAASTGPMAPRETAT
jgi:hypothetical protein